MRKIVLLLFVLTLCFDVAGCGGDKPPEPAPPPAADQAPQAPQGPTPAQQKGRIPKFVPK